MDRLISVTPSPRQLKLQNMEFYAFIHFGINTFTDREWGDGSDDPRIFSPASLNPDQWVSAVKSAGMTGLILTCKHHDGFCLWPSRYTNYSVVSSPCKTDVVAETARACKDAGIRFGIYLSPWDRNNATYGTGKPYDDYFVAQLTELLTQYGDIFCVWLDGACGEGQNGKKQYYDWERYHKTIRTLQPDATIHVCGPDIRWCGNEAGDTRPSEWSVVPRRTSDTEKVASASQQADDRAFRLRKISARDRDLGSREILENEDDLIWYPAEVNTSIRPGWFYHSSEDGLVKPLDALVSIYEHAVGGNATFLLNIPPTPEGLLHANDVARLEQLGNYLQSTYGDNLLLNECTVDASASAENCAIGSVLADDDSYYQPAHDLPADIMLTWTKVQTIRRIVLKEQILLSQRIEAFSVDAFVDNEWITQYNGTVVGYKKIVPMPTIRTNRLRIRIIASRDLPTIKYLAVY